SLPVDQAARLTAVVGSAVAAYALQVDGGLDAPPPCPLDGVARLGSGTDNPHPSAAVLEHLPHERHALQLPLLVEGAKDLFLATNLDPVARPQRQHRGVCCRIAHGRHVQMNGGTIASSAFTEPASRQPRARSSGSRAAGCTSHHGCAIPVIAATDGTPLVSTRN